MRGLSACAAAKDAGAELVLVTGYGPRDAERLDVGSQLRRGHRRRRRGRQSGRRRCADATGGRLADVVVDVTAKAPAALGQAVALARPGGTVVLAGTRGSDETPGFAPDHIVYKELHLVGALGVDATAYADSARRCSPRGSGRSSPCLASVSDLDSVEDLVRLMAGEVDATPPVHAVLIPS